MNQVHHWETKREHVVFHVEMALSTLCLVLHGVNMGFGTSPSGPSTEMGNMLVVGVNSDAWLKRKKGRSFMPLDERGAIISELLMVDKVVGFEDDYDADDSAVKFIKDMREYNPEAEIIFANGGDRTVVSCGELW